MNQHFTFVFIAMSAFSSISIAQERREVFEVEIEASVDDIWDAFTTTEGIKSWVAPLADIDFKIGGKWRANYNKDGKLGDATTIENTILCYDPKRMIYFAPISNTKTKITVVGLGYNDTPQSKKMRAFFEGANKYSMDQLSAALKKKTAKKDSPN